MSGHGGQGAAGAGRRQRSVAMNGVSNPRPTWTPGTDAGRAAASSASSRGESVGTLDAPPAPDGPASGGLSSYEAFLARKAVVAPMCGLQTVPPLAPHLFPFQRDCVAFGLRAGSWACFLSTGLGKTAIELEWCRHAMAASNGRALILTPLAVARQIEAEGRRWGYAVRVIREQHEASDGINVCNYDRLDKLDTTAFGAVALDESSILKAFTGATTRALIRALAGHRWRMAATATPAPNDHMELGQHAECLGIMPSNEMLMRWFTTDQTQMGRYRLKGHAEAAFWDWMASWARMASHPRDLGDDCPGFDLPPLEVERHRVEAVATPPDGALFGALAVSATDMHRVKRETAEARAAAAAAVVGCEPGEPWIVWCDTDYEQDALEAALPADATISTRGSHAVAQKEQAIAAWLAGERPVLIGKPSMLGFGLNFQHCARMCFVGRTFSYEMYYQAVRRCWRFGQTRPVRVHLVVAAGEHAIGQVIDRKAADHATMQRAMAAAMHRARDRSAALRVAYDPRHQGRLPQWMTSAA